MEPFGKDCEIDVHPLTVSVPPSPTLGIKAVADQMKQRGIVN